MCKFCENYDFKNIGWKIDNGKPIIFFPGGSGVAENRFRFCPVCRTELTFQDTADEGRTSAPMVSAGNENIKSWIATYRNKWNGDRVTAAVLAENLEEASRKARANAEVNGCKGWRIEALVPFNTFASEETALSENAKDTIERFAKIQEDSFFPCPRCGQMQMDEKPHRNALSRRADVQICDACGMAEALEDTSGRVLSLNEWAIIRHPENFQKAGE